MSSVLTWLTERTPDVNSADMAEAKSRYHHGDLLTQIEQIAWQKVRQSGADQLSLRSCARDAGVDAAAVYRHFKSKGDLLKHLSNRAFSDLANTMDAAQNQHLDKDPEEALTQVGLAYIRYATAEPHVFQMMFDVAGRKKPGTVPSPSPAADRAFQFLVDGIVRLKPQSPVDVHVFMLWSVVHGFASLANTGLGPDAQHFDQISRALCETAVQSIK